MSISNYEDKLPFARGRKLTLQANQSIPHKYALFRLIKPILVAMWDICKVQELF